MLIYSRNQNQFCKAIINKLNIISKILKKNHKWRSKKFPVTAYLASRYTSKAIDRSKLYNEPTHMYMLTLTYSYRILTFLITLKSPKNSLDIHNPDYNI